MSALVPVTRRGVTIHVPQHAADMARRIAALDDDLFMIASVIPAVMNTVGGEADRFESAWLSEIAGTKQPHRLAMLEDILAKEVQP